MTALAVVAVLLGAAAALVDTQVAELARASRGPFARAMVAITDVGLGKWYVYPALAVFLALGALDYGAMDRPRRLRLSLLFGQAGFAAAAIGLPQIIVNSLKDAVGRARPHLYDLGGAFQFDPFNGTGPYASFPSGHAATCGALATVLSLWFPRAAAPIMAAGVFFASTRVVALRHYLSDIVIGYLIGALFALWLARLLARRRLAFGAAPGKMIPRVR